MAELFWHSLPHYMIWRNWFVSTSLVLFFVKYIFYDALRCNCKMSPGKAHHTTENSGIYISYAHMHVLGWAGLSRSVMSDSVTPWTVAHQGPLPRILQARIPEWIVIPSSRGPSQTRGQTQVSHIACVCLVAPSCPTLFDPMDCDPPGSSVHRIL